MVSTLIISLHLIVSSVPNYLSLPCVLALYTPPWNLYGEWLVYRQLVNGPDQLGVTKLEILPTFNMSEGSQQYSNVTLLTNFSGLCHRSRIVYEAPMAPKVLLKVELTETRKTSLG